MPLPRFEYLKPKTVREVCHLLAEHGTAAKIFAGGTDLLVLMRDKIVKPKYLIDVKGIDELHELSYDEKKGLSIGSTVTLNQITESNVVKKYFGVLWSTANSLGDPTLRNRATLVGNICNASPASDMAPALLLLDAEVEVVSEDGGRTIPIQRFFAGVKRTSLKPKEFVKLVRIPSKFKGARGCYLKWGRTRGEDLAVVGVAGLVDPTKKLMRIALSSVAPTPLRILDAKKMPDERSSINEQINKVVSMVLDKISPISDVRGSREYRVHMAEVLTRRILEQLLGVKS